MMILGVLPTADVSRLFLSAQWSGWILWVLVGVIALVFAFYWFFHLKLKALHTQNQSLLEENKILERRENELKVENAERVRLEKILERGKQEWEGIFDAVQDAIIVTDPAGTIIRCNDAATRELHKGFDELVNKKDDQIEIGEKDGRALYLKEASGEVFFHKTQQWFDLTRYPLHYEDDQPGTITILRDVTERKRVETIIATQKEYLQTLIDNSPVAIITTDVEKRITACNPAFRIMFGYSEKETISKRIDQLLIDTDLAADAHSLADQVMKSERVKGLSQRLNKDGAVIDVEISGVPLKLNDEMVGALWIYHDITDLMQARRMAEAADRAKSEFLANISHEIRTPMNGIMGMLDLTLGTELSDEQYSFLVAARDSAEALLNVLNSVLDFSKIEAGQLQLEKIPFDLHAVVEGVVQTLANRSEAKAVELFSFVDSNVPSRLKGDPSRLRQVLLNLVGNAIKFTEKGEVLVRAESAQEEESSVQIYFIVRDTGIGIPIERQQAIFERFVQADGSTTRQYGGTGLGLTISKELVEMMGGKITVESIPNRGSTFSFTLPFEKLGEEAPSPPVPINMQNIRILIVDDNQTNRIILTRMIEGMGFEAAAVATGREVTPVLFRGLLTNSPFDLILLDMQMPGMDGESVLREIRQEPLTKDIKVIILTSIGKRNELARATELGCSAYLLKPIRQSQLREVIYRVLGGGAEGWVEIQRPKRRTGELIGPGRRILVVEDNDLNQRMVQIMLSRKGHEVVVASNGMQAVEMVKDGHFDLVFMDVQMPVMDGLAATRLIRESEPQNQHTPIVAMTAYAMQGDAKRCLDAGMDDYVSKPLDPGHVFEVIQAWTGGVPESRKGFSDDKLTTTSNDANLEKTEAIKAFPVLDFEDALPRFAGEVDTYTRFLLEFIQNLSEVMIQIRAELTAGNLTELSNLAHNLKGVSASLGAKQLANLAFSLDHQSRDGQAVNADLTIHEIELAVTRLKQDTELFFGRHGFSESLDR